MSLLILLFFLGLSQAVEETETQQSSVLRQTLLRWAKQAGEAVTSEVREAASQLEQLVNLAGHPDVQQLANLYKDNHHFLHHCDFPELQGLPSCINVTGDLANLTILAISGYQLADQMADAIVYILNELNTCQGESLFPEIKCYKHAFGDIQADIKEYTVDCNNFLSNATVVLKEFGVDIKNCFSHSEKFSVDLVETKIEQCKRNVKEKFFLS